MKNKINSRVLILLGLLNVLCVESLEVPLPRDLRGVLIPGLHLRHFVAGPEFMAQLNPGFLAELRARDPFVTESLCDVICQTNNLRKWQARTYFYIDGERQHHCTCYERRGIKRSLGEFDVDPDLFRDSKKPAATC